MLDIRLDFISKFKDHDKAIASMTEARKMFIAIDEALVELGNALEDGAFKRSISLARTHNEEACQHAIKALCLLWEDK